jgi:hypothetical protein
MFGDKSMRTSKFLFGLAICFCASTMIATRAHASAHLWNITELYSNASGTLQFIEMFTTSTGQSNFTTTRTIQVTGFPAYTVPATTLAGSTQNRNLLFGTAGLAAAGGPTPDFIIPNNFLPTGGGTINFFGAGDGPYGVLPTNGLASYNWVGGTTNAQNSPTNYSGITGVVNGVPEPSSILLLSLAMGSFYCVSRRRIQNSVARPD